MTGPIIEFGDRTAEGFVKILDLSIQNLRKSQEGSELGLYAGRESATGR